MSIEAMKKVLAYTDNDDRIPSEINHILAQAIAEAEKQEPFGHVTVRRLSERFENHADLYEFYPAGHRPYLDNVDECHEVYTSPPKHEPCPFVVSTKEGTHHCALAHRESQYDKTEMNAFVQNLYDQKMREGKHGHYETMFHVVHKAIEQAHGIKEKNR